MSNILSFFSPLRSSETDDGQVELQTIDGKTITTRQNQLSVSPADLPGAYPYPMSPIAPGYGYRYFPAYYPFYQQGQFLYSKFNFFTLSFHNAPGRLSSQQVNTILTAIWKPNLTPRNFMKLLTSTAMAPDKLPPLLRILWHPFLTPS